MWRWGRYPLLYKMRSIVIHLRVIYIIVVDFYRFEGPTEVTQTPASSLETPCQTNFWNRQQICFKPLRYLSCILIHFTEQQGPLILIIVIIIVVATGILKRKTPKYMYHGHILYNFKILFCQRPKMYMHVAVLRAVAHHWLFRIHQCFGLY